MALPQDAENEREASAAAISLLLRYLDAESISAHGALGDVAGVAITLAVGGTPLTIGSSTPLAREVDLVQYDYDIGPCLHALRTGESLYVPDLAGDRRWDPYGPEAARRGAISCLSIPVVLDGAPAAVFKVYASRVDGLSAGQRELGVELAAALEGEIALAQRLVVNTEELDDRIAAMNGRRTIDVAVGILMERAGVDDTSAFALLRSLSQTSNTKLREVARRLVVAGGVSPQDGHAPFQRADDRRTPTG